MKKFLFPNLSVLVSLTFAISMNIHGMENNPNFENQQLKLALRLKTNPSKEEDSIRYSRINQGLDQYHLLCAPDLTFSALNETLGKLRKLYNIPEPHLAGLMETHNSVLNALIYEKSHDLWSFAKEYESQPLSKALTGLDHIKYLLEQELLESIEIYEQVFNNPHPRAGELKKANQ